jgi:hypothetical protein
MQLAGNIDEYMTGGYWPGHPFARSFACPGFCMATIAPPVYLRVVMVIYHLRLNDAGS